jgi:hypothetical protein
MLMSFRNLVLSSAALCATAAFAAEQKTVVVPFGFVANNHAYQAGAYTVSIDNTRSFVTLSEVGKSTQPLMWIVGAGAADPIHSKVSLTFDVTESGKVLRTIQYQTLTTPNLDKKLKHTVESTTRLGE